jgi:hypothetical protein
VLPSVCIATCHHAAFIGEAPDSIIGRLACVVENVAPGNASCPWTAVRSA